MKRKEKRTAPGIRPARFRRWILLAVLVLLLSAVGVGQWMGHRAAAAMRGRDFAAARRYLAWERRFRPWSDAAPRAHAAALRHLQRSAEWRAFVEPYQKTTSRAWQIERTLGRIQQGDLAPDTQRQLEDLLAQGADPAETAEAFVLGFLVKQDPMQAERVLEAWRNDQPDNPELYYAEARVAHALGHSRRALSAAKQVLLAYPNHEPARWLAAELYMEFEAFTRAMQIYQSLESTTCALEAALGKARCFRLTGQADSAQRLLTQLYQNSQADDIKRELGLTALDRGNYAEAVRWLDALGPDVPVVEAGIEARGLALAMLGQHGRADECFARQAHALGTRKRIRDLQVRMTLDPQDAAAREEFERLSAK